MEDTLVWRKLRPSIQHTVESAVYTPVLDIIKHQLKYPAWHRVRSGVLHELRNRVENIIIDKVESQVEESIGEDFK